MISFQAETGFLRQFLPQGEVTAVGIEVGFPQRLFRRGDGPGRRAQGILVRRQLDDAGRVQAQFPGHLLDRLARFVDRLGEYPRVRELGEGHRASPLFSRSRLK
jgi:hypothetical protein